MADPYTVLYMSVDDMINVSAVITADDAIKSIMVEIHGNGQDLDYDVTGGAAGKNSYTLNEDLDVSSLPTGTYDVHLIVADQLGLVREFEASFTK